ncbi:MAG: hypothetical protein OXC92_05540 [Flavobacteriaceae bacterium]|nr:hypothetical protein [Flavobacteriaceae bacterium]
MRLLLLSFFFLPLCICAQEKTDRFMLEAGLVGGSENACPGHYIGLSGEVTGPLSLYSMIENYQCQDLKGTASRLGASLRIGPTDWLIRPELRTGIEYDGGDVSFTYGTSLLVGGNFGARLSLHVGESLTLFQLGGYIRF